MTSDENQFCTEVKRRVVANERNGSGRFTNENREPPFGIEKTDIEWDCTALMGVEGLKSGRKKRARNLIDE